MHYLRCEKTAGLAPQKSNCARRCPSACPPANFRPAGAESQRRLAALRATPPFLTPGSSVAKITTDVLKRSSPKSGSILSSQLSSTIVNICDIRDDRRGFTSPDGGSTQSGAIAVEHAAASLRSLGRDAWATYNQALLRKPLPTKSVVMALGLATGDVFAQLMTTGDANNLTRTAHMAFFGLAVQGPAMHYLHKFLDRRIRPDNPTSVGAVLSKVSIDQGLFAPAAIAAYISYMQLAGGNASPDAIALVLQTSWAPTLQANYLLWPAALLVNYSLCPPQHRILFINMITVVWSAVLSTTTTP